MLTRKTFLVKERVAMLKLVDTFDIFDAESGEQIGVAEEQPGGLVHVLRLVINKRLMPTKVVITDHATDETVVTIKRGFTFLRSKVMIYDGDQQPIGYFKSKLFSLGGGFYVYDLQDRQIAEVKGDWKGWNFKIIDTAGNELGTITKKWAGIGKELFTSADNYVIALAEVDPGKAALLLAAGIAIDVVFKEK